MPRHRGGGSAPAANDAAKERRRGVGSCREVGGTDPIDGKEEERAERSDQWAEMTPVTGKPRVHASSVSNFEEATQFFHDREMRS